MRVGDVVICLNSLKWGQSWGFDEQGLFGFGALGMPDLIIYTLPSEEQGCTQHFSELILFTRFGRRGGLGV